MPISFRASRLRALSLIAVALLTAACGGGGGGDEASTDASSTTAAAAADASTTSTTKGGGSGASESDGTADSTTTTAAATVTTSGGSSSSGSDDPGVVAPATGRYTYRVSGSSKFGATEQDVPPTATLTVADLSGDDQRHTTTAEGSESQSVYRFGDDAVLLVSIKTSQSGVTKEFRPQPPVVFTPVPLEVGDTWEWTIKSTDGKTTVHQRSKAVRTERRTVGGTSIDTIVVSTTVTLSGDVNATTQQTTWASQTHGLAVRIEQSTSGTFGALAFSSKSTSELASLRPA